MPDYRRYYIPNSIVFITCVTKDRKKCLKLNNDITLFFQTLNQVQQIHPFHLLAYVILPDHFHFLLNARNVNSDFSIIMKSIKWNYTLNYKKAHNITTTLKLWQRGFWDHVIRDDGDLKNHFNYIHWNPVKHVYVEIPEDWKYSTYQFWLKRGYYPSDSKKTNIPSNILDMNFE